MKIFSIKEIIVATNGILNPNFEKTSKNSNFKKEKKRQITSSLKITKKKISKTYKKKISIKDKTQLKPEFSDHIVDELYIYLKKKVRKNTLKLIIDEQIEIRNLNKKINFLKDIESKLTANYQSLKNEYKKVINNFNIIKNDKEILEETFNQISDQNKILINKSGKVEDAFSS